MLDKIKKIILKNPTTVLLIFFNIVFLSAIGALLILHNNKNIAPQALIAPHIQMGKIILRVSNMNDMKSFYVNLLGMQAISENDRQVDLGYNQNAVLDLINASNLSVPGPSDPGLDQIAIVFNSRPGLARVLQRVLNLNPNLYQGGTGRGAIGEAFYVTDPAGNNLELYYDTDPSTWPRSALGNVEGDSLPIDIYQYVQKYSGLSGDNGMKLGHLQMRIGDIEQGKEFYLRTIGFYAVPSLLHATSIFMSDGYYHHDLVINQASSYDGDKADKYLGLAGFSFSVPRKYYLDKLEQRLTLAKVNFKKDGSSILFSDPWGFVITVFVKPMSFMDYFY